MTKPYEPIPDDWQRALCAVAHPDDLQYGPARAVAERTARGTFVAWRLSRNRSRRPVRRRGTGGGSQQMIRSGLSRSRA